MADGPERAAERALELAADPPPDVDLTGIGSDRDSAVGRELVPLAPPTERERGRSTRSVGPTSTAGAAANTSAR